MHSRTALGLKTNRQTKEGKRAFLFAEKNFRAASSTLEQVADWDPCSGATLRSVCTANRDFPQSANTVHSPTATNLELNSAKFSVVVNEEAKGQSRRRRSAACVHPPVTLNRRSGTNSAGKKKDLQLFLPLKFLECVSIVANAWWKSLRTRVSPSSTNRSLPSPFARVEQVQGTDPRRSCSGVSVKLKFSKKRSKLTESLCFGGRLP